MTILDSQMKFKYHGKRFIQRINPFKEDVFSLGLTFL